LLINLLGAASGGVPLCRTFTSSNTRALARRVNRCVIVPLRARSTSASRFSRD